MNIFKRWNITLAGLWASSLAFTNADHQISSHKVMNTSSFDDDQTGQLTSRNHYSFRQNDFIQHVNAYLKYNDPNPPLLLNVRDISQGLDFIYMNYLFYQEDGQDRFMNFIRKVSEKDSVKYLDHLYDLTEDLNEERKFYPRDSFDRQETIEKSRKIYQRLAIIDQLLLHYAPAHRHVENKANHFYLSRSHNDALALVGLNIYAESLGVFDLSLPESDAYLTNYLTPGHPSSPFYVDGLYEITTWNHAFVMRVDKQQLHIFDSNYGLYTNSSLMMERVKPYAHEESNQLLVHSYAIGPARKKLLLSYPDALLFRDKIQAQAEKSNDFWKNDLLSSSRLTSIEKKFIGQMFFNDCVVKGSDEFLQSQIDFLLTLGVDIDISLENEVSPLQAAISLNNMKMMQLLIHKGAKINLLDVHGNTILMRTVQAGYTEGVDYLIAQGIDMSTQNNKGQTALHIALENRYSAIAALLIEKGIDLDLIDNYGETALHIAAQKKYMDIVSLLVEHGASLELKDCKNKTPLMILQEKYPGDQAVKTIERHQARVDNHRAPKFLRGSFST